MTMKFMDTDTKDKWLYDIFLDNLIVANQGDYAFDTKEEAEADANQYIEDTLDRMLFYFKIILLRKRLNLQQFLRNRYQLSKC